MNIRSVIFDFAGVLCFHPDEEQFAQAAELCGLPFDRFHDAFWLKRHAYDRGQDASKYWQEIAATAGSSFDEATIAELVRREVGFWSRYDQRVLGWAAQLQTKGYRTSILSNLPRPIGEALRATPGFLDPFHQVTFSYELGVIKPEREIYEYALRGLGASPEEALFLDDRPENVQGARDAGLHAELFTSWEDFLTSHRERYLLPEPDVSSPSPS